MASRIEKQVTLYQEAGFSRKSLGRLRLFLESCEDCYASAQIFSPQLADLLTGTFVTQDQQNFLFPADADYCNGAFEDTLSLVSDLVRDLRKGDDPNYPQNLSLIVGKIFKERELHRRQFHRERLVGMIGLASQIIANTTSFALFDGDLESVKSFVTKYISNDFDLFEVETLQTFISLINLGNFGRVGSVSFTTLKSAFRSHRLRLTGDWFEEMVHTVEDRFDQYGKKLATHVLVHQFTNNLWSDRLQSLENIISAANFGEASAEEVDDVLIWEYARQLASEDLGGKDNWSQAFVALAANYHAQINDGDPDERNQILSHLHYRHRQNGLIKANRSLGKSEARKAEFEQAKRIAARYEHPLHPFNTLELTRKFGYEIEYPKPRLRSSQRYDFINAIQGVGIGIGNGGYGTIEGNGYDEFDEISPGPFRHPNTAIEIFRLFQHANLIDTRVHVGQSIHLNTNAFTDGADTNYTGDSHLATLACSLLLTGYAFDPSFTPFADDGYNYLLEDQSLMQIEHHRSYGFEDSDEVDTNRDEVKAFDLLDPSGFAHFWNQAVYLGNAGGAYHRLRRRHVSTFAKPYFKQLAEIWTFHDHQLYKGLKSVNLTSLRSLNLSSYDRFVSLFREVFPDCYSRTVNPDDVESSSPVNIGEQTWPNIISFARDLNRQTMGNVLLVLGELERQFIKDLKQIQLTKDEMTRRQFLKQYHLPAKSPVDGTDSIEALSSLESLC